VQLSLFDERNLAVISSPDFPGERLVVCKKPALTQKRHRKRQDLLAATEAKLDKLVLEVARRTKKPLTQVEIARKAERALRHYKMSKHFNLTIADGVFAYQRRDDTIAREAELDGIYVIRTSEPAERRRGTQLQASVPGGAGVSQHQGHRPDSPSHSPPRGAARARAPLSVHAGLLRQMAHAARSGAAALCRRGAVRTARHA
jgi:hypothetical protein